MIKLFTEFKYETTVYGEPWRLKDTNSQNLIKKKTISVKIRQLVIKITNLYDTNTIKFKLNTEYAAIYVHTRGSFIVIRFAYTHHMASFTMLHTTLRTIIATLFANTHHVASFTMISFRLLILLPEAS